MLYHARSLKDYQQILGSILIEKPSDEPKEEQKTQLITGVAAVQKVMSTKWIPLCQSHYYQLAKG